MLWHKRRKYHHLPLHLSIIKGKDPKIVKKVSPLEQDWMGFSAPMLDALLHRGYFPLSSQTPPVIKQGKVLASTPKEYEALFQISYLPQLIFDHYNTLRWVVGCCKKAEKKGMFSREQRWLGAYFEKEVEKIFLPPLEVRWIDDKIGYGLFAKERIFKKTFIGEYSGRLRKKRGRADYKNSYCFEYFIGEMRATPFTVDAQDEGNYTRFVNHSTKGNCDPKLIYDGSVMRVILYSNRLIEKGEEIAYDYGSDYWAKREAPVPR